MHVKIVVTNDDGQTFEGEADLARAGAGRCATRPADARAGPGGAGSSRDAKLDFKLPLRAFLKKHATGGGPRKFAILLARLTDGKTGVEVTRETVEKGWTRNKGILGGAFQDMYTTRSKG